MESKDASEGGLERQWVEINSKRGTPSGANFERGVIDMDWSVGGRYGWRPSMSYFRIGLSLKKNTGGVLSQPQVWDNLALADDVCAGLFDNIYCRAGGSDISSIINYAPQAHILKTRLHKSRAWMNSAGKAGFGLNPSFDDRVNQISTGGVSSGEGAHKRRFPICPNNATATVALTDTGAVVGVGTTFAALAAPGYTFVLNGKEYTVISVADNLNMTVRTSSADVDDTGDQTNAYFIGATYPQTDSSTVYVNWVPPVGIFDYEGLLGSAEYRIQLNPNSRYKKACVQSLIDLDPNSNYEFEVTDLQFYACIEKSNLPASGTESLFLREIAIQSKTMTNPTSSNILDMTVPPSTQMLAVFVQSQDAGSNTIVPLTSFKTKDESDRGIENLQITYANTTRPPTNWSSKFEPGTNQLQQRYLSSMLESGMISDTGGCETMEEWLERGAYYLHDFTRDANDRSTNVQLAIKYANIEQNANVYLAAIYTRRIDIVTQNGRVVDVTSLAV